MSTAELPLGDLVETAVEDTVATAEPNAGRWLVDELERRGSETMWEGALLLFGPLASRPAYGLSDEREAAVRLRGNARSADPATALLLEMRLAHGDQGEDAAFELWRRASPELRRIAVMQWLISYCMVIGHRSLCLTPAQTVVLIRHGIPRAS